MRAKCGQTNGRVALMSATLVSALALTTGCELDASGVGGGMPEPTCTLDFDVTGTNIDFEPDVAGLQHEGDLLANQDFAISWSFIYIGHHDWEGIYIGPYEYRTRIRILEDGEPVFETEFDSEPIDVGDFENDNMVFEGGLPSGDYVFEVTIDIDNTVPECEGLPYALNNFQTREFTVSPVPIDDVSNGPGGGSPSNSPRS